MTLAFVKSALPVAGEGLSAAVMGLDDTLTNRITVGVLQGGTGRYFYLSSIMNQALIAFQLIAQVAIAVTVPFSWMVHLGIGVGISVLYFRK